MFVLTAISQTTRKSDREKNVLLFYFMLYYNPLSFTYLIKKMLKELLIRKKTRLFLQSSNVTNKTNNKRPIISS